MQVGAKWVLVDPVALPRRSPAAGIPAEVRAGEIRTVGFFSNSKQNAAEIQAAMARAVAEQFGIQARFYRKPNASVPAAAELLTNIATECDAVVTGSGD